MYVTDTFIGRERCGVGVVSFKNESNGDTPTKTVLAAIMLEILMKFEGWKRGSICKECFLAPYERFSLVGEENGGDFC